MYDKLEDVRADIDRRLRQGAEVWRSVMHTPVVATADADARVMVLREYDPATATLRFHTDGRSPKSVLIGKAAPVGVVFYDHEAKVQLRCRGTGRIERSGPLVDGAWAQSSNFARRCYLGDGPGATADAPTSGLPSAFEGVEPEEADLVPARENFAILLVALEAFDWLYLAQSGNRRALFDSNGGRWVTP